MASNERRCGGCEFFDGEGEGGETGRCHFNAPFPSLKSSMMSEKFYTDATITWPQVKASDWCGRYSCKPQ